jgi:hypothetical protein
MINVNLIEPGVQLRALKEIEKNFKGCFFKDDVITVDQINDNDDCPHLIVICRNKGFHYVEDFICNNSGDIDTFEVVRH